MSVGQVLVDETVDAIRAAHDKLVECAADGIDIYIGYKVKSEDGEIIDRVANFKELVPNKALKDANLTIKPVGP